jgi:hypothetical protein
VATDRIDRILTLIDTALAADQPIRPTRPHGGDAEGRAHAHPRTRCT